MNVPTDQIPLAEDLTVSVLSSPKLSIWEAAFPCKKLLIIYFLDKQPPDPVW